MQSGMLSIDHISHHFGKKSVLDDISLQVEAGAFVCLAGISGSGKSTLLRLIAGLEHVQAGSIRINDTTIAATDTHLPPEQRGVGIVFQHPSLFPHLNVLENVMFGLNNIPRAEAKERAHALLEHVHFSGREQDYPHMLSGGQHQRVALARALAPSPSIMLLDEPFANLDSSLRRTIREETKSLLKSQSTTTIMVTHDPQEALVMADSICLLDSKGRILQTGEPEQLYLHPDNKEVAAFFGQVNLIDGQTKAGMFDCVLGTFPVGDHNPNSTTMVLRPEALRIDDDTKAAKVEVLDAYFAGGCQHVRVVVGETSLLVCDTAHHPVSKGDSVNLGVVPGAAHFF